jgi:hypothetical protein
MHKIITFQEDT